MIKEKNDLKTFFIKIIETYKKYQNEILNINKKENIKLKEEFKKGLDNNEKCLKENKEITNENKEEIFKLIIETLSFERVNNIIEISLESIDIIASNDYFPEEIINNNINNLTEKLILVYKNYNNNSKIIMQIFDLIKTFIGSQSFNLKNESLYNIIIILILNNTDFHICEDRITTYQSRKLSKLVLNKLLEKLIYESDNINIEFENKKNIKYYRKTHIYENLYNNYFNQLMKYYIDNILVDIVKKDNNKNEKGIDKGKYNWCFNCRNEANYFSEDLSLPICSKKCEYMIKYTEKLLNMETYYNNEKYSIFQDYINVIKIITSYALYYLKLYLFNFKININFHIKLKTLDDKLNYFIEIIYILLSQSIIKDNKHNKYILDLIKEYIFPFLFEISLFNKRANNLNGFQNNIKMFELLINELDNWYLQNLKIEIYTFMEKIILPFFSNNIYNDDYINDSNNYLNKLQIIGYLIEFFNSNIKNFIFELYINYDTHLYYKNIYINIIKYITNILYDNYDHKLNDDSEKNIMTKIKQSFLNFVINLISEIEKYANEFYLNNNNINEKDNNEIHEDNIELKKILDDSVEKFCLNPSSIINYFIKNEIIPQAKEHIKYKEIYIKNNIHISSENKKLLPKDSNKTKRNKYNLPYFPQLHKNENNIISEKDTKVILYDFFNINFSLSLNYDDFTAYILSCFIRLQFEKIMTNNKLIISNFFSSFSAFSIKVLFYYIYSFNFKNYNILEAIHLLFNYLPLVNRQQIIEKILNIFCDKFIEDNYNIDEDHKKYDFINIYFLKLAEMIVEISNVIVKENNIQNQIKIKKLKTINDYLKIFKKDFEFYKNEEKLKIMNYSYIYDIYNLTLTYPLNLYIYPNTNSLIDLDGIIQSNNNLYGVFPAILFKMDIIKSITIDNLYKLRKNMNKEDLRNLIISSWEYFFDIFSKQLAYYNDSEHIIKGIENMLIMGKVCDMLKLDIINNAFINSTINMIGLNESIHNKLNYKNILILKNFFTFLNVNGKYIYSSWYLIFCLISKINQLKQCKPDLMYYVLNIKNIDLKIFIDNYIYNKNQVESIDVPSIFETTKEYSLDVLKKFIIDLIKISNDEINLFKNEKYKKIEERFFCLNKLIYVININRERLENNNNINICEIVKEYFVKLVKENSFEDILVNKIKNSFINID